MICGKKPKPNTITVYDWDQWHVKDLQDQILRDRNHPSIFMWSIGNEIPEQWSDEGVVIAKELSAIVKKLDTTRLVTAGNESCR